MLVHLVVAFWNRTGNNQRRAGVVYKHRVDLVNYSVIVRPLNKILRTYSHVVAKIVETELVVRSEGYVGLICLAACLAVRLVLVDTIDAEAVEHVQRAHPLRVTLCQIVVNSYDMNSIASQSVQEYRQSSHEGFTLTCRHLGNLTLM